MEHHVTSLAFRTFAIVTTGLASQTQPGKLRQAQGALLTSEMLSGAKLDNTANEGSLKEVHDRAIVLLATNRLGHLQLTFTTATTRRIWLMAANTAIDLP